MVLNLKNTCPEQIKHDDQSQNSLTILLLYNLNITLLKQIATATSLTPFQSKREHPLHLRLRTYLKSLD